MIGDSNTKVDIAEQAAGMGGFPGVMMHAMAMQEHMGDLAKPGKFAMFNNFRYQQTMLKGGFYDDAMFGGRVGKALGRNKFRIFDGGMEATGLEARSFAFGSRFGTPTARGLKKLAKAAEGGHGVYPMSAGFRANYLNPIHWFSGRMHSTTVFGAGSHANYYAPVGGGFLSTTGNQVINAGRAVKRFATGGKLFDKSAAREAENYFNGGVIGRLGAITRATRIAERGGNLAKYDMNLARVMAMNNPASMTSFRAYSGGEFGRILPRNLNAGVTLGPGETFVPKIAGLAGIEGAAPVTMGMRRYATVEGMTGKYSKAFTQNILTSGGGEEMRTMMGSAGMKEFGIGSIQMTDQFERLARPLAQTIEGGGAFSDFLASKGIARPFVSMEGAATAASAEAAEGFVAREAGLMATELVEKGFIKTLGVRGAIKTVGAVGAEAGVKAGARIGLAVGGEAMLAAIPGVNLLFAADMAYNLAKLAGYGIKAGINFSKQGLKSMTGTMNNGIMGNGYKDNEVAATSRARGVMAIQNSRMNARSLLGSEATMMHAHFG